MKYLEDVLIRPVISEKSYDRLEDNNAYTFGDTVNISGTLSDTLLTKNSTPEIVKIKIQGPSYYKNLALFPDRDLNFSTSLKLQQALGFKEGNYSVIVSYGDNIENLSFYIKPQIGKTWKLF